MGKYDELLNSCVNSLRICKKFIETRLENEEQEELQNIIKDVTKKYCEIDSEYKRCRTAVGKTKEYFSNEENDCTRQVQEVYQEFLNNEVEELNYVQHPIWKRVNREQKKTNESTNAECSVLATQTFEPPVDPITKKPILDPYKNKACGHVYDYNSILIYIQSSKSGNVRCPYIGCNVINMDMSCLEKDEQLKDDIDDFISSCT